LSNDEQLLVGVRDLGRLLVVDVVDEVDVVDMDELVFVFMLKFDVGRGKVKPPLFVTVVALRNVGLVFVGSFIKCCCPNSFTGLSSSSIPNTQLDN
jgi:hypothetical protein